MNCDQQFEKLDLFSHTSMHIFNWTNSAGKESACSAGDPGSIPGLGRSPGEGLGYPLLYSQVSLVAQW